MKAAAESLDEAKRNWRGCQLDREQWEKQNPIKAKLGVGEGRKLAQREQQAKASYEQAEQFGRQLGQDKGIQSKAREQADNHNLKIAQAKVELKTIGPRYERAKEEVKEQEQAQKLVIKQRGHGHGHGMGL